jgi:hypothetical protein
VVSLVGRTGEIVLARTLGEREKAETLEEQKKEIEKYLSSAINKVGRSRRMDSQKDKVRKAVFKAIKEPRTNIRSVHPELAQHLDDSIKTGSDCSYKPSPMVHWES